MKIRTSTVWNYYEATNPAEAKCRICGRIVPRRSRCTTNLRSHIKNKHVIAFKELLETDAAQKAKVIKELHNITKAIRKSTPKETSSIQESPKLVKTSTCDTVTSPRSKNSHYEALVSEVLADFESDALPSVINNAVCVSRNVEVPSEDYDILIVSGIKKETVDDDSERPREAENETDVWQYFEKIPSNRARCILCKETFNRHTPFLTKHMTERHRKVALDLPSDSDEDQDYYTEVVYLEDEQPVTVESKPKRIKRKPEPTIHYRRSNYVKKIRENEPKNDEIENFGRYVIGLLKDMPKHVCTQLQMGIINMIMTAKLNKIATSPNESMNVSMNSVQDGVIVSPSNGIVATPSNVIVTTPSNVIHTGENNDNLPSLVIGVDKES